jgi:hypothetical protein
MIIYKEKSEEIEVWFEGKEGSMIMNKERFKRVRNIDEKGYQHIKIFLEPIYYWLCNNTPSLNCRNGITKIGENYYYFEFEHDWELENLKNALSKLK